MKINTKKLYNLMPKSYKIDAISFKINAEPAA